MKQSIVIVGGGLGGLTSAILLAKKGYQVYLFDKAKKLGGRACSQLKRGRVFNLGPHALYKGVAYDTFKKMGLDLAGQSPSMSGSQFLYQNKLQPIPSSFLNTILTPSMSYAEKVTFIQLIYKIQRIDSKSLSDISFESWLAQQVLDTNAKSMISALCRLSTYSHSPEFLSADAAIFQLQLMLKGVLYLDNGWQRIVDQLELIARQNNVIIQTACRVTKIHDGERVGVTLNNGEFFQSNAVIAALPPKELLYMLTSDSKNYKSLMKWWIHQRPSYAACLNLALSDLPNSKIKFVLGIDTPLYYSVHSDSANLSSNNEVIIHVARYIDNVRATKVSTQHLKEELYTFLDRIQPSWKNFCIEQQFLPYMLVSTAFPTSSLNGLQGRPSPQLHSTSHLFLVGDWIGSEGMLVDATIASAKETVKKLTFKSI